ncbi:hypothetical protein BDR05DRAFT_847302, partial [Suillus weaverae]
NAPTATTMAAVFRMPIRRTESAPKFNGRTESLNEFLDQYEDLADQAALNGQDRIKGLIRYLSANNKELWAGVPQAQQGDFDAFITAVKVMYPGCEGDRCFTLMDLHTLSRNQSTGAMRSQIELGDYFCEYIRVLQYLMAKSRIGEIERNHIFLEGAQNSTSNLCCLFCGAFEHFLSCCREKNTYINAGKCMVHPHMQKIVLPDGNWIPGRPGDSTMKERLDRHYAKQMKEVQPNQSINVGKSARFDGMDIPSGTRTHPGPASKQSKEVPPVASTSSSSSSSNTANITNPLSTMPSSNQYRYSYPLEDKNADKHILEHILDMTISIPIREILAISPDVHKVFCDQTTTKHITVGTVSVNELLSQPELEEWMRGYDEVRLRSNDGKVIADHYMPLRCVHMTTFGGRVLTCMLDQGAEVVVMPEVVWKMLSVGMCSDYCLNMESVNMSKDATLGVIENVPLDFGGGPMYFQVQVMKHTNFDILLGRPFFKLTSCHTSDLPDGEQDIFLTDPN